MQLFTKASELRHHLKKQRQEGKSIGLVPTMGNLHAGHLKLVRKAVDQCDHIVATIFVNPLQFDKDEDLDSYPRSPEQDQAKLNSNGCDVLFAPSIEEIYGESLDLQTLIHVPGISESFCGKSRPTHFDGVATVVCKLFNIVSPNSAYFGLKDYQQFLIIEKLVQDLAMDIDIVGVETEREASGLALSSRNAYLSSTEKLQASRIHDCLVEVAQAIKQGNRDFSKMENEALELLRNAGLKPDYFAVCNARTLQPASCKDEFLVILSAAYVGPSRLIDNIRFELNS